MISPEPVKFDDAIAQRCATDPAFREYWEKTALARAVSIAVIRHRSEHGLSQRQLAQQLGMAHPQIARLELGEHNPSIETLQRLARGLGRRFIFGLAPAHHSQDLPLPEGAEVLADVILADGTRLLAATA